MENLSNIKIIYVAPSMTAQIQDWIEPEKYSVSTLLLHFQNFESQKWHKIKINEVFYAKLKSSK